MAHISASLPQLRTALVGFTALGSATPPCFRRKKRRERWRPLWFEFQRRRRNPNKSWVGGGGDRGSRAGRDSGASGGAAPTDTNDTVASVSGMDSVLEEDVTLPGTLSGCRCGPAGGFALSAQVAH